MSHFSFSSRTPNEREMSALEQLGGSSQNVVPYRSNTSLMQNRSNRRSYFELKLFEISPKVQNPTAAKNCSHFSILGGF